MCEYRREGGSSRSNAGHIAASDIHPLSGPGILAHGLRAFLNKDGPLHIPGLAKLTHLPWMLRFLLTARPQRQARAVAALTALCTDAIPALTEMLNAAGLAGHLIPGGCGYIYGSAQSRAASLAAWQAKAAAGFAARPMPQAEIADRLPDLSPTLCDGMESLNWACVSEPLELARALCRVAGENGAQFARQRVTYIQPAADGVVLRVDGHSRGFDAVVIAAGVASGGFARNLGDPLPMVAERGYNLTFPDPGFSLSMPLVFPDLGVVATQVKSGLRIGGHAEYAAPGRAPDSRIFRSIARTSTRLFPGLNQDGAVQWMGCRPSLPDSVPVISRSPRAARVFYNTGHGHYGLTHAAVSAKILAGLLTDEITASGTLSGPAAAYSIKRFI